MLASGVGFMGFVCVVLESMTSLSFQVGFFFAFSFRCFEPEAYDRRLTAVLGTAERDVDHI